MLELLNGELWTLGNTKITLASLLTAVGMFLVALAIALVFRRFVERVGRSSKSKGAAAFYVAAQVGRYVIIFVGLLISGSALGLDITSLSVFAGALGVGIGLGVQDIFKDFIAGLVLLFDRSIEVGDFVELETGVAGEIKAVGARATTLLTNDNVDVLIPNSMLLTNRLTNWTRNRATRRIHVPFSVAYGSNKETVRAAAIEAAQAMPFTLPDAEDRKTQVWLVGFGDSSLDFELVVWPTLEAVKRPGSMMAGYRWALDDALRRYGLEIPFPQRDLRIRSFFGNEESAGLEAWRGERPHERAPAGRPATIGGSVNDAAEEIAGKEQEQAEAAIWEAAEIAGKAADALQAQEPESANGQVTKRSPR